tara:strand:- start:1032 stop:1205 length:174 start_codon:yes stop_codon:yes gene_type:complete
MNKKQLLKIKRIIGYEPSNPEHKRLLNRLKKEYQSLPQGKKVFLLKDLKKLFNKTDD